jgi:hypothetical protein
MAVGHELEAFQPEFFAELVYRFHARFKRGRDFPIRHVPRIGPR